MGALAPPSATCLHPNHFRHDQIDIIDEWIADSLKSNFIAGPWSLAEVEATVGPIHAPPLHIVTKTDENGVVLKHRVVYDASYPRTRPQDPPPPTPSINSQLDKADLPCEWMTANDTKMMVSQLPPYARVAGFDLAWAFQQLSNKPEQRPLFCINVRDQIYVWLLNALYSLRNTFRGQHKAAKKHLPTAARAEVRSWLEFFQQGPVTCSLSFPTHLHPTPLYTDASDFGLGIVFGDHAITIPLPADYTARPGINIGVGEAWAFELGVYAAIQHGAVNCILTTSQRHHNFRTPSASFPAPQRHELTDQAAQSRQHALTIIGSLSVADTSSGSALTPAEVWNSLSADNTPTCSLTGKKADDLGREHVLVELSPAEHLVAAIHGSLPLHTIQQLRQFRSHRVKLDTRKSYGGHVVAFLRWADDLDIPQHMRFPIPPTIVLLYFSSAAPFYAANTLSKMVSGLQAWHAVHALPWALDRVEARTLRQALANLALPPLDPRRPVRLADFEAMQRHMAVADRAHTAVYTCALFSLWSMARHGELTVDVVAIQ
ncbi:unnamed protein product [Tilletia controversa]|nr:unnamed protein product [Tilletia controversa]